MTGLLSVFRIFVIYIISTNNAVLGGVISKYFLFQKNSIARVIKQTYNHEKLMKYDPKYVWV